MSGAGGGEMSSAESSLLTGSLIGEAL